MNILYIHQYFVTPRQQGGTRSYELSRYLIGKGHRVTMITSGLQNPEFPVWDGEAVTEYETDGTRVGTVKKFNEKYESREDRLTTTATTTDYDPSSLRRDKGEMLPIVCLPAPQRGWTGRLACSWTRRR